MAAVQLRERRTGLSRTFLEVHNARTHNLKGIDCRIPHGAVTVVTGPSGAGKSSLAFDTVFAEGQRRFLESMSTYARQFIEQRERPPVDSIDNILPAVAIEAKNSIKNARSTVGTISEAYDVLRLVFTHLGEVQCPNGHGALRRWSPEGAAAALAAGVAGERFLILVPLPRPAKRADDALAELVRQGFGRRLANGEIVRMEPGERWPKALDPLPVVLGRFSATGEASSRLVETLEEAFRLGDGRAEARADGGERVTFSRQLGCSRCGAAGRPPTPALFSFNSPLGACPTCQGFGRVIGVDRDRVVPDPGRSLAERPFAPWNTPGYEDLYEPFLAAARQKGLPLDRPWRELSEEEREWAWSGRGRHTNLGKFFRWLEGKIYKVHVRVLLARYRAYSPCPDCAGRRLVAEALAVELDGRTIADFAAMSIEELRSWLGAIRFSASQRKLAGHLLDELGERIEVLHRVGLDYLTLDRQARTLSGGETQRIHLAAALGSGLTTTLYVLDEPTIGLHPQDSERLLGLLRSLAARGNTVLVVEHDRTLIRGADHVIDLGPGAGELGGRLMVEGSLEAVLACEESLTGRFLRDRGPTAAREHLARFRREQGIEPLSVELGARPRVRIEGARAHNLRGFDVEFPLHSLVAVTGVSGSGKSTLIENVLFGTYQRSRGVADAEPGECDRLLGLEAFTDVTLVDQSPLGRSSRSNPVTYLKIYDEIRKLLAATGAARSRRIEPGHFSFNVDRGRCPVCLGTGVLEVDMQFMAPVVVTCDECQGRRFQKAVLAVEYRGKNVAEILDLTVDEALGFFHDQRRIVSRLRVLVDVGLSYLRLGQSTATLSGGEAQRLKLAAFLERPAGEGARLFLFDEPTSGLHLSDIDLLYGTLRRLVQRGDSVVVVEHNEDLVAHADWIVDLGPGGGSHGGELLFSGPLETFLEGVSSPTADEIRRHLRWPRLAVAAS